MNLTLDGARRVSSKGIHLVPGLARANESAHNNTRLVLSDYIADILVDRRFIPPIYHWVVQRIGSADVVKWGQEASFGDAEAAARDCITGRAMAVEKKSH